MPRREHAPDDGDSLTIPGRPAHRTSTLDVQRASWRGIPTNARPRGTLTRPAGETRAVGAPVPGFSVSAHIAVAEHREPYCAHAGGGTRRVSRGVVMTLVSAFVCGSAGAFECAGPEPDAADLGGQGALTEMSLEQLMDVTITSLYRKPQSVAETPAPVFVITREDIRRSGVTTIPDALRMAPGIQVARVNSHAWAVTSRGFNSFFANKLLVLIDGRNVYSTSFSGVSWELDDTMLEDVDRIEVIRGPGSAAWGSNAVNGVINIITRCAGDTQGQLVSARAGTLDRARVAARHGGKIAGQPYRIYVQGLRREGFAGSARFDDDAWKRIQAGFRSDLALGGDDAVRLSGDVYDGSNQQPNQITFSPETEDVFGVNLNAAWDHRLSEESQFTLSAYFDRRARRSDSADLKVDTVDVAFQHRLGWGVSGFGGRHELMWGLGYRRIMDEIEDRPGVQFRPSDEDFSLKTAFVRNEFRFLDDRVRVIAGARFEDNDFTGLEVQPSARVLWTPDERLSLWGAVSGAVHLPSRANRAVITSTRVPESSNPFSPVPLVIRGIANPDTDSTRAVFYELGARGRLGDSLNWDVSVFRAEYDDVVETVALGTAFDPAAGAVVSSLGGDNSGSASSTGLELSLTFRPAESVRVQTAYTYLDIDAKGTAPLGISRAPAIEGRSPRHQLSVRPSFNLSRRTDLDLWFRYVDELQNPTIGRVESYLTMDARLAWRPVDGLELSIVGQNLFDSERIEFGADEFNRHATAIERAGYVQLRWTSR